MISIKDRLFLDIRVNSVPLPLELLAFDSLTMHSAYPFLFPCAQLVIADNIKYFTQYPIVDGDIISITTGKLMDESQENNTRVFRVFDSRNSQQGNSHVYTFDLIFGNIKFVNENSKASYKGRVSDVFREIADYCNMEYEIAPTADSQIWYPLGAKRALFIKEITKYAYSSNKSCFISGVTTSGKLRLVNLETLDFANPKVIMVYNNKDTKNSIRIADRKEYTSSGLENSMSAYKSHMLLQDTDKTEVVSSVEVPVKSNTLNVNDNINKDLQGSNFIFSPIDNGNTHPNYNQAKYQNGRIISTFSKGLIVVTDEESKADLLDVTNYIDFAMSANKVEMNKLLSGGYLITAKTILIRVNQYYEKMQLMRQGFNADVITQNSLNLIGVS